MMKNTIQIKITIIYSRKEYILMKKREKNISYSLGNIVVHIKKGWYTKNK